LPGAEAYYDLRHQLIYQAFLSMFDTRKTIDSLTITQYLKDHQQLDEIGGISYLERLRDSLTSTENLRDYLEIVRQKHVLRRFLRACTEATVRVYEVNGDFQQFTESSQRSIMRSLEAANLKPTKEIKDLVIEAMSDIEASIERKGPAGIATGFTDFDRMTDGLHAGEMIVVAGRPSTGKTSWAMNVADHAAVNLKLPVAVFSLEMTASSLIQRMICSRARVNLRDARQGFMSERDTPRLVAASSRIAAAPLYIDDSAGISILQLRARAKRLHQQHGIKLFVVDYLQLLSAMGGQRRHDNRQQEVTEISSGIKCLAKELDVPVLILSQLNRALERDKGRAPRLCDLRESGSIEQDADVVGLLYNSGNEDADYAAAPVTLFLAKQRCGPVGDVPLVFLRQITRFENSAKIESDDCPQPRLPYK